MGYSQEEEDEIYTKILKGEGAPQRVYDEDDFVPDPVVEGINDGHSTVTFSLKNLNYVKQKLFDPEIKYLSDKLKNEVQQICDKNKKEFEFTMD